MDARRRSTAAAATQGDRRPWLALLLASVLAVGLLVASGPAQASASGPSASAEDVDLQLWKVGRIVDGGFGLVVRGRARCPVGFDVLEANVNVSQDGVNADMGSFGVPCDGRWHRWRSKIVVFDDVPYTRGRAFGSAFVLVEDPEGVTQLFDNATRRMWLVPPRRLA